ncbi:MAG: hypothetical protein AAFQ09_04585 [Pseudomonadota bacterium]
MLIPQNLWATPEDDALLIAERWFDEQWREMAEDRIKRAFVAAYFQPLAGQGISILDEDRFMALVPATDIAPHMTRLIAQIATGYEAVLTPAQLAAFSEVLRADQGLTLSEMMSDNFQRKLTDALDEVRLSAPASDTDDPEVLALQELAVQLEAFEQAMSDGGAEAFGQGLVLGISPLFAIMRTAGDIGRMEVDLNNPVSIAALRANGVLRFSNPVQRQTLLRQVDRSDVAGGIRFIRPPSSAAGSE